MTKSREPKNKVGEDITLSSGVVVNVTALAPGLIQQIQKDNPENNQSLILYSGENPVIL